MAKDVIETSDGEQVVREDTAKSYRGVMWALTSVGLIVLIAAVLFFVFGLGNAGDGNGLKSPGTIENSARR